MPDLIMGSKMRHLPSILIALLAASTLHHVTGQPPAPAYCTGLDTSTKPNPIPFRPNPPRVWPFCIGKDPETGKWDDIIEDSGFGYVLDTINVRNIPQPTSSTPYQGFEYSISDHLIDDPVPALGDPYYITSALHIHMVEKTKASSPSRVFLDNWLLLDFLGMFRNKHDQIRSIHGVYIQGIQGPLGIPFGEFILHDDYGRGHNSAEVKDGEPQPPPRRGWMQMSRTYPCTFYSKAGPTIPNVFLFSSKLNGGKPVPVTTTNLKVRIPALFRWNDPVCAEVAFMQFLVLIVYEWSNPVTQIPMLEFRVGGSPVVLPGKLLFRSSGIAHPYYPDWGDKDLVSFRDYTMDDAVEWSYSDGKHRAERIVSNFHYEACVQHQIGLVKSGPGKGACPPGPFKCSEKAIKNRPASSSVLNDRKNAMWTKWRQIYLAFKPTQQACGPPPHPPTTEMPTTDVPTTLEPILAITKHEEAIALVAKKVEQRKVISHGDLCVFIWFVLIPLGNFFARFFKDFPNWSLGVGFWIVSHVLMHHLGVLFMWISFGLVVSNGVSFLGGAGLAHYMYGFPATFIQHYELFVGFVRSNKLQTAARQSTLHAINGFLAGILSLCCCASTHIHPHKLYIVIALFATDVLAVISGSILEWKISKRLGFFPPRKFFPVLERVMMVNSKPRFYKLKIFMACVYVVIITALYTAYYLYDGKIKKWLL